MKIIRQKFPKLAVINYVGFHYYDRGDNDETVAWWWYGVWRWDSMWWCVGLLWQLRATTLRMAHTSVSRWWKPAAGQGTNRPFSGPPTKTVNSFNKYTPAFSIRAVWVMCSLCYVIYPPIITLFTNPCRVQLMRRGSSKAKDSLCSEPHLRKPKQEGCTLWGVC